MSTRTRVLNVTEKDLTPAMLPELFPLGGAVRYNSFFYSRHFESDVVFLDTAGFYVEFEFKNNYADFKLDFTKCIGRMRSNDSRRTRKPGDTRTFKHDLVRDGETGAKAFYFVCPTGVIPAAAVPEHCGLIYLDRDLFGATYAEIVIEAPALPKPRQLTPALL